MDNVELLKALQSDGASHTYKNFLMNDEVWLFKDKNADPIDFYRKFKIAVSDALDVSFQNVAIVGSAKIGYSLNPKNKFRPFNDDSDLDLIIVSPDYFKLIWDGYYNFRRTIFGGTKHYSATAKFIFRHFVSITPDDVESEEAKYFALWIEKVDTLKKRLELEFHMPKKINYRVYESWKYVDDYHIDGLDDLMKQANK